MEDNTTFLDVKNAIEASDAGFHKAIKDTNDKTNERVMKLEGRINKFERFGGGDSHDHASTARPKYPSREEFESRAMAIGTESLGGFLVTPDSAVWFNRLRARNVFMNAGPVIVPMTSDSLPLPKLVTSATASQIGEGDTITASDLTIGKSTIFARKYGAYSTVSSELLADSNPAARSLIAEDQVAQIANLIDLQVLSGNGAGGNILGLRHSGTVTELGAGNGLAITLAAVEALVYRLEAANADMDQVHLFCHPRTWSSLRRELDGQLRYQLQPDPTSEARKRLFGLKVSVSSQISITETVGSNSDCSYIVGVDMSRAVVGLRENVGVLLDPYTRAQSDQVNIRTLARVGFALVNTAAAQVLTGVRA